MLELYDWTMRQHGSMHLDSHLHYIAGRYLQRDGDELGRLRSCWHGQASARSAGLKNAFELVQVNCV
jgi:hypothetical protein